MSYRPMQMVSRVPSDLLHWQLGTKVTMNPVDAPVSLFFSSLGAHHPALTSFFNLLAGSYFFRGGVLILMLFWVWFYPGPETRRRRQVLVVSLVACVLALAIGRVLVTSLPVRVRPNDNPVFHFAVAPYSSNKTPESSFPSDHAILFVALATGIFLASRRVGSLALAYALTVICLPRLWLGFHFLSDLLAGALIGGGLVLLFNWHDLRSFVARPLLALLDAKPHMFYTGLFFFSYQVAEIFDPARDFLAYLHLHVPALIVYIMGR